MMQIFYEQDVTNIAWIVPKLFLVCVQIFFYGSTKVKCSFITIHNKLQSRTNEGLGIFEVGGVLLFIEKE